MKRYNPKDIEPKWQKVWEEQKLYQADGSADKPKYYALEYFPYPSGVTMHVGHVRNYVISDTDARHKRMQGYNVLHPMGWDAFGLPAENYAIKNGVSPRESTDTNVAIFKRQLTQVGLSYDWSREIDSSRPDYYKWTQWLFLQFFKKGLAYKAEAPVNWCPKDKTVLANEQVIKVDGKSVCERCETEVEKKRLSQWLLKITAYADRLLQDLDDLDWPESIKTMQRNWIGKSKGAEVKFQVAGDESQEITVFTTRPDTLFGATFMVLAPEHPLIEKITTDEQKDAVSAYVKTSQTKSDIERQETDREKTGVFTGAYAINPANQKKIPIWIADYVLTGYGTGAIMAVPAHDERDHAFAKKFDLLVVRVIQNDAADDECSPDEGSMINSGEYNGLNSSVTREKIVADLAAKGVATEKINYRMRDWLISRQRYWGAPIPIVYCEKCGAVAVPDDQLPVELPPLKSYEPSDDGRSPLARVPEFVRAECPQCNGPAERETDTMDTFIDSSWYFLRFTDPHNPEAAFDIEKANYWLPVDSYVGGAEHAVAHLLFARFWTKFLCDEGLISHNEPFKRLRNQGMIGGSDGRKMGKRYGNVVTPDEIIEQGYGADALRLFELFIAPFDQGSPWNTNGVPGTFRFLQRLWTLTQEYLEEAQSPELGVQSSSQDPQLSSVTHRTIKKVSRDLEDFSLNTAVAAMMEAVNELYKIKAKHGFAPRETWQECLLKLIQLLAPFAPHIAEELWQQLGQEGSVHVSSWPVHDEKYLVSDTMNIVVQVNGKVRAQVELLAESTEDQVIAAAQADPKVATHLNDQTIKKTIYVPQKLVNFVV